MTAALDRLEQLLAAATPGPSFSRLLRDGGETHPPAQPTHIGRSSMTRHYEIYADDTGEFRWRYKTANGEIIASGEGYKDIRDAEHAIRLLQDSTGSTLRHITVIPAEMQGGEE